MNFSLKAVVVVMLVSLTLQMTGMYKLVCLFMSIVGGIFTAGVFNFGVSLPVDNGFATTPAVTANLLLGFSLGEGLLIMPIGYCMQFFGF